TARLVGVTGDHGQFVSERRQEGRLPVRRQGGEKRNGLRDAHRRSWLVHDTTSRGRLFTSTPRSSSTLSRTFPFMTRPSGLARSASGLPGRSDRMMSSVGCLRQYSRENRPEPVSNV